MLCVLVCHVGCESTAIHRKIQHSQGTEVEVKVLSKKKSVKAVQCIKYVLKQRKTKYESLEKNCLVPVSNKIIWQGLHVAPLGLFDEFVCNFFMSNVF